MTTIPEDDVLNEDIKVLRPLNEVKMDQINYHQIIRSFIKPEHSKSAQQQAETGGKSSKAKGFVDQSGRGIPSQAAKQGSRVTTKGTLLRGGIPTGPAANRKSLRQPAKPAAGDTNTGKLTSSKNVQDDQNNNDEFYNMDELLDLLGLQSNEV